MAVPAHSLKVKRFQTCLSTTKNLRMDGAERDAMSGRNTNPTCFEERTPADFRGIAGLEVAVVCCESMQGREIQFT